MRRKVFVFILILFTVVLVACSDDDEKTNDVIEERSIPVEVTEVIQEDFIVEKSLTGRVEPKDMTPVMLEMSGEISELNVKNGDRVEEDDVIAKMKTQVGEIDIKAPTSGEVTELSAKEDVLVSNEEPLAILLDLDELSITFAVTNKVRELFGKDETYKVTVEDKEYDMEIDTIHKLPDDTGLYPVDATIKNKDEKVLPGMIGKVFLPEKRHEEVIVLPTEAIVEESEGSFVYTVENDRAKKVEITVVDAQTDVTAVEGDLSEDDEVVINGQLTLSDGSKVDVVKEENES